MTSYSKSVGRIRLDVNEQGVLSHDYGHGCSLKIVDGWNDSCPIKDNALSVDELCDLQYLISRALEFARLIMEMDGAKSRKVMAHPFNSHGRF